MTIDEFVENMKQKVSDGLLEVSGTGKLSKRTWDFTNGQAEVMVIRGGAIEKAAIQHLALRGITQPGTDVSFDAFVFHIKVYPENPYCPMGHFNTEWMTMVPCRYTIVMDLFPAVPVEEDLRVMKSAIDVVADRFGRDSEIMRQELATQYNMDHFAVPLAAKVGLKLVGLGEEDLDLLFTAHQTFLNVYLDILRKRKTNSYTEADVQLKLERNGKWLEYFMLKDGAVKAGRDRGIPPEVLIEMGFPPLATF
jgi:coproporphyrinogen III oxidase